MRSLLTNKNESRCRLIWVTLYIRQVDGGCLRSLIASGLSHMQMMQDQTRRGQRIINLENSNIM